MPHTMLARDSLLTARCRALCGILLTAAAFAGGCSRPNELSSVYGMRRGLGANSVNGTLVLSEMFGAAGFRVSSWRRLSPKLDREQVIVWFPDRFRVPYPEEVKYLTAWLAEQPHRTLVYVARDYDAELDYWRAAAAHASPGQRLLIRHQQADVESQFVARRWREQSDASCDWFRLDPSQPPARISLLSGPWGLASAADDAQIWAHTDYVLPTNRSAEIDADSDLNVDEPQSRTSPHWETRPLLLGDGDRLVAGEIRHEDWPRSKLIVIANGSWLLNYPLIHHPHRRLAARLVDECGPPSRVCFLESGPDVLGIFDSDTSVPIILRVFSVFPFNVLMLHLLAVGLFYCFAVLPIFGRPATLPDDQVSDFGKHVTAVGEMLERGHHQQYAAQQVTQFHQARNKQSK